MKYGLNLGSGPVHLDSTNEINWINSDSADTESGNSWDLEARMDFTQPLPLDSNSLDYIIFWHCIEHLGLHERDNTLEEILRVLKPEGLLFIACPDMTKIAQHIIDRDGPWADWFICAVNVMGPYNGFVGDYHKWIYNEAELKRVLLEDGFKEVNELNPDTLRLMIGENANKIGFAPYNVQLIAKK